MRRIALRKKIARSFGIASDSYDFSARLQRYSGKKLMPWLPENKDSVVVDLGSGTGFFSRILSSHFKQTIGLDISFSMLSVAKQRAECDMLWLQGDGMQLPFQDNSVDLVFSNLVIQWCNPLETLLNEVMRVLKPGGAFIFTTLLDGTLNELKHAWEAVDSDQHVIRFASQPEIVDIISNENAMLMEEQINEIILDYEDVKHLAYELKGLGANQVPNKKNKGLAGKDKWQKMCNAYKQFKTPEGVYPATYMLYSAKVVKPS